MSNSYEFGQRYETSKFQQAYDDENLELKPQILTLKAIETDNGVIYVLSTKLDGWSFSEPEQIYDMLKTFVRDSETIFCR